MAQAQPFPMLSTAGSAADRVATLDAILAQLPRGSLSLFDAIAVSVGYPYVHHMILPWQDEVIVPADRIAYAESMLEQQYGIARADWYCEIAQERFGCAAIASAIRRDIVDEIVSACKKNAIRLLGLSTVLTESIKAYSGSSHPDAVYVVRHSDGYEFAFRRDRLWVNAFALPGTGQTPEQAVMAASMMANYFPTDIHVIDYVVSASQSQSSQLDLGILAGAETVGTHVSITQESKNVSL
ncbi:hypothetical protein [Glaciimonas immobilis]|uniref:Uncharacterized protein n=1 Tax=Glaciimonas immobilis TaxID=728004 RepID=A0A840RYH4_9BURK|nr:hypothetical protein [Glaciimonas immobilis]KAF3998300.1 hypothetical protein HAV38_08825 [Glaciimonas immobilis]MBB5201916.1 hypothetical protein [Glaciimonas immobilis]